MSRRDLSEQEGEALGQRRFARTEAALVRNVPIILRTAAGRPQASMARDLGCRPGAVANLPHRDQQQGREGLRRGHPPGRPSRAPAEYRAALRQAVQTPPPQLGYGVSVWSVARRGQPLKQQPGTSFGEEQVGRLLPQGGFSCQRPKHPLQGKREEGADEQARQEVPAMKKKPGPGRLPPC